MSVVAAFDDFVPTLTVRTPEVEILVEVGRALAWEIDTAPLVNSDEKAKPRSAAAASTALRSCVADLMVKGRASANSDEAQAEADWTNPVTSITAAAGARAAKVRNATNPGARDAGARGRGSRKTAS